MRDKMQAAGRLPDNIPPPWLIEKVRKEKEVPKERPRIQPPKPPPPLREGPQRKKEQDDGLVDYTI
jgi:hypothetical protein